MTKLDDWMKKSKTRDVELAAQVGCDRSVISKMRHGKLTPKLPLAVRIVNVTGLKVDDLVVPKETQS